MGSVLLWAEALQRDERERSDRHAGERRADGVPCRMPERDVRPDEPVLDLRCGEQARIHSCGTEASQLLLRRG